jgi:hypothetical protein
MHTHNLAEWRHDHVFDTGNIAGDPDVWRVSKGTYSCALSVVTHDERLTPKRVREWLSVHDEILHSTIEIHYCDAD